ncbi:MAG: hypothetical protein ACRDBG_22550 [Waterburya sp.]
MLSAFERFPNAWKVRENEIYSRSLIATFDEHYDFILEFWENYQDNLVNPLTVDERLLDRLAMRFISPWRTLWNSDWDVSAKRLLLRDQNLIFSRRLFPDTLTLLFEHFELQSRIAFTSGWILGSTVPPATPLPAVMDSSIFNYKILTRHQIGTPEYTLTEWIGKQFGAPFDITIEVE